VSRFDRYILSTIIVPLFMLLGVAVLLLLLDQMLRLFQFVLDENGSADVVWRMLATLLPEYIALALPIGFCLGVLLGVRRLSLSSELDASLAAGVPLRRILAPIFLLGVLLCGTNLLITGFVQPIAAYAYSRLQFEVRSSLLTARVREGTVIKLSEGVTLRVGAVVDGDRPWRNVFFERCEGMMTCTAIMAQSGQLLERADEEGRLVLRLFDARSVRLGPEGPRADVAGFPQGTIALDQETPAAFRMRGGVRQEVTLPELIRQLAHPRHLAASRANELSASLHWRLLHSLLILILPFSAIALGLADKRNDRGLSFIFGVVGVVLYYRLLQGAEARVAVGQASPWLTMWPVFALYAAASVAIFWACSERVGFKPFEWLEFMVEEARLKLAAGLRRMRRA